MADDNREKGFDVIEELCWGYLDGGLSEQEIDQFVRLLLMNKELRHELSRHLLVHDGLRVMALRGWDE